MLNQQAIKPLFVEEEKEKQLEENDTLQESTMLQTQQTETKLVDKIHVIHNLTTPKVSYQELADRINNKTYDRSVFVKWKKSNSKTMEEITNTLSILNDMLEASVVMFDYKDINREYQLLSGKCLKYLNSHHPRTDEGKARLDLVQKIYARVLEDRHNLDVNAGHLKEEDKNNLITWKYMIEDHTVIRIPKKQIVSSEGQEYSGSSTVTKLRGETTYYLKSQETMPRTSDLKVLKEQLKAEYERKIHEIDDPSNPQYSGMTEEVKAQKRAAFVGTIDLMNRMDEWIVAIGEDSIRNVDEKKWKEMITSEDCIKAYKLTEEDKPLFLSFTRELSKRVVLYKAGHQDAMIPSGSVLDVRNEATSVLADTLGISGIIMGSRSIEVEVEGERYKALRMQEVFGMNGYSDLCDEKYLGKTIEMTPTALKQYQTLQIFDVICGQVDRNYNNILLQTEETEDKLIIKSITGIDNDLSFGLLTYNDITFKLDQFKKHDNIGWLRPIEDTNHRTFLTGVDKQFADKILELKPDMLKYILGPYVSKKEIDACQDRLKGVQEHLKTIISRDKKKDPEDRIVMSTEAEWASRLKSLVDTEGLDEETKKAHDAYMKRLKTHSYIMDHCLHKKMDQFPNFFVWGEYLMKKKEEAEKKAKQQGEKPQVETVKTDEGQ